MIRTGFRLGLTLGGLGAVLWAQDVQIRSDRILIRFDHQLRRSIEWFGGQRGTIVAFDPSVQEGVRISGVD